MDRKEIAKIYIERMGLMPVCGEGFEPVMPFIMMDVVYQTFKEEIMPLEAKNRLKMIRQRWDKNYRHFNHEFFRAFNKDEAVAVTDMMDEFEEYIANDLMIVKSTVMGCFDDLDFERKKVIGATMLCNIITQSANLLWHMVYRDNHGRAIKNPHLSAIEKSTHDFANEYHTTNKVIDLNTSEKLKSCVDSLCYKMMHFLDI